MRALKENCDKKKYEAENCDKKKSEATEAAVGIGHANGGRTEARY